ncbi:MAG: pirin family protein [Rhodoferax sp.]|uniref:pirin family protein n=1 Tax=Rhodoferax sp. TaxID=50421 RepID=UPI002721FCDC|nr:pirin family protein [Rhodoferax sp.]MDO8449452.1 pirin family protein [Rhodoferax sp.]
MSDILRITGRLSALADGLKVRRVLPAAARRAVGPFVFFDHFGPVTLQPETDSDVGAHPHIGLATVSYLFEGSLLHRDSLGTVQKITPGAINWMTAGRGIVHSERVTNEELGKPRRLHGLQLWVALPPALELTEPSFQHVPAADLPAQVQRNGVQVRVLVGEAFGARSPVQPASPTLYLDVQLPPHTEWELPALVAEMAVYSPEHNFDLNGESMAAQEMAVLPVDSVARLRAGALGARLIVIGGAPLEQPVRMWWNFVSTDRARIADAAQRWEEDRFEAIPGETQRVAAPKWNL